MVELPICSNLIILPEVMCDILPLGSVHVIQFYSNVKFKYGLANDYIDHIPTLLIQKSDSWTSMHMKVQYSITLLHKLG